MKRFLNLNYYLSMTLIASMFMLASCGDDTEDIDDVVDGQPNISFGAGAGEDDMSTVGVGEAVSFNITVTAPGGINRVVVDRVDGATPDNLVDTARASGDIPTTFTVPFSYTATAADAGQTLEFEVLAVGEDDQEATATYMIMVNEATVTSFNAVLLDAPLADQSSNVWFSSSTGEVYSTADVNVTTAALSAEIDFGYRYGPTAGATLASPAAYPSEGGQTMENWLESNETMLRVTSISPSQFMEQGESATYIMEAFEGGTEGANGNPQRITSLTEGQVLAFMTDPDKEGGSKYGLIHVEEIIEGTGTEGQITLNVKVAE